jgi:putative transposase
MGPSGFEFTEGLPFQVDRIPGAAHGLLLVFLDHAANIPDRDGAKPVSARAQELGAWLKKERVWAEGGSVGKWNAWVSRLCHLVLEIVKRNDDVKGFKLLPRR